MASTESGRSGASPQPRNCGKSSERHFRAVGFANVEHRCPQLGMAQKDPRQFQTGITVDTHDGDLARVLTSRRLNLFLQGFTRFLLGVMISTVSSPGNGSAISGNFAPSTAHEGLCAAGRSFLARANSPRDEYREETR